MDDLHKILESKQLERGNFAVKSGYQILLSQGGRGETYHWLNYVSQGWVFLFRQHSGEESWHSTM